MAVCSQIKNLKI